MVEPQRDFLERGGVPVKMVYLMMSRPIAQYPSGDKAKLLASSRMTDHPTNVNRLADPSHHRPA
jgi:hypothetical protein